MQFGDFIRELISSAGDLWFLALIGSFFVMICEAAKPKPREGEDKSAPRDFALLVMILSLITPLMLFAHAFAMGGASLPGIIAIVMLLGALIVGSAIIGWVIGAAAPDVGRTLNRAVPVLAVAVFALTAYVTWRTVFDLMNALVTRFAS